MSEPEAIDLSRYKGIGRGGLKLCEDGEVLALLKELPSLRQLSLHLKVRRNWLSAHLKERGLVEIHERMPPTIIEHPLRGGKGTALKGEALVQNIRREADDVMDRIWRATEATWDAEQALDTEQDLVEIAVDTDRPIAFSALGDIHTGSSGVNPRAIQALIKGVQNVDGLYLALNGDLLEQGLPGTPDSLRHDQNQRVTFQRRCAEDIARRVKDCCVGVSTGQHEWFAKRAADFDFAQALAEKAEAPYIGPGGAFFLRVGEEPYSIGVWHKYAGSSIYDQTAGAKRCCQEQGPYDVTMVADKHAPAMSQEIRNGHQLRTFMRGGTLKLIDNYGKSLGYLNSAFAFPLVILWPYQRAMWATADLAAGLDYLEFLRED